MIEEHAQGNNPILLLDGIDIDGLRMFSAEKEMYREMVEDVRLIMTEYFEYWQPRDLKFLPVKDETGELRYAEHEFELEIGSDLLFKGQIDGLGVTPSKLQWLVENKTFTQLPSDDHRWRNLQSVVYINAAVSLGMIDRLDGVCWNYIKSKPPTVPKLLKNGELSIRDIVTLPSVVRAQAKLHDVDTPAKLLERAEQARHEYFQRIYTPVNPTIADNIFTGFVETSREMRQYHGTSKDKNLGRQCEWCSYEPLCRAELTGGDVDFVKEREFEHEDPEAYRRSKREVTSEATNQKARGKGSPQLRVIREERDRKDNPRIRFSEAHPPPRRKGPGGR